MKRKLTHFYSVLLGVVLLLSLVTNWYIELVIALNAVLFIWVLSKLGDGLVLRESTAFLYALTCLLMPVVGYLFYTRQNPLSRIWLKYMPISEEQYFSFALPAVCAFCFALTLPLTQRADEGGLLKVTIKRVRNLLLTRRNEGISILVVGLVVSYVVQFLPGSLQFFGSLFYFSAFSGLLYIYFSPGFKNKKILILLFAVFLINNAIATGMFTLVTYMGVTIFSFFFFGTRISVLTKTAFIAVALVSIMALQSSKRTYRQMTWVQGYEGNKIGLFADLFLENLSKGSGLFENELFFPIYSRLNQGQNVSFVIRKFDRKGEFDNGERLFSVFLSAFVPRFLWPDKPEAGGVFNMNYYADYKIGGWSTNVGPVGEAYGSFGKYGGIVYLFGLGLFVRWAFGMVFKLAKKYPLLICWIPVLFYQVTYSNETDTLAIINSLVKTAFFIWLLFKAFPSWFGVLVLYKFRPKPVPSS